MRGSRFTQKMGQLKCRVKTSWQTRRIRVRIPTTTVGHSHPFTFKYNSLYVVALRVDPPNGATTTSEFQLKYTNFEQKTIHFATHLYTWRQNTTRVNPIAHRTNENVKSPLTTKNHRTYLHREWVRCCARCEYRCRASTVGIESQFGLYSYIYALCSGLCSVNRLIYSKRDGKIGRRNTQCRRATRWTHQKHHPQRQDISSASPYQKICIQMVNRVWQLSHSPTISSVLYESRLPKVRTAHSANVNNLTHIAIHEFSITPILHTVA